MFESLHGARGWGSSREYGLDGPMFESLHGARGYLHLIVQTGYGTYPTPAFLKGVKRPRRGGHHSLPSSAKVKNEWSFTYTSIHLSTVWTWATLAFFSQDMGLKCMHRTEITRTLIFYKWVIWNYVIKLWNNYAKYKKSLLNVIKVNVKETFTL